MVQENSHFEVMNIIISEVKGNTNDLKYGYIATSLKKTKKDQQNYKCFIIV